MTAVALRQSRSASTARRRATKLAVQREDIAFRDVAPGWVEISITVTNLSDEPSAPDVAVIQAAPLGAFVPWRPLAVVPVPMLQPGASHTLTVQAARPRVQALGNPDQVSPQRLLTGLGMDDDPQARQ